MIDLGISHLKHDPTLDGLRGVAITAVVLFHAYPWAFIGGWMGVDIFFVLSGYLISTILKQEIAKTGTLSFKSFYMRRILRLGPAATSLYLFQLFRAIFSSHGLVILQATAVSGLYFMNWSRAFDLFPEDILGHTWSLSVEEQFYFLWPPALILINRRKPTVWLLIAITSVVLWRCGLVALGQRPERTYNGFDTHCDGLLIGCLVSFYINHDRLRWISQLAVAPIVAAMCVAIFLLPYDSAATQSIGLTIIAIAFALLMVSSFENRRLRRFLSTRALVFTGKISYGWYLWHWPLMLLATFRFERHGWIEVFVLAGSIVLSYLAAVGSYFLIELPFLRLKKTYYAATDICPLQIARKDSA